LKKDRAFEKASTLLGFYQEKFSSALKKESSLLGEDSALKEACEYSVSSGGKRVRPALVWMIAESLNSKVSLDYAAIAVELFHAASLVADDLPCMDNDEVRRGLPTTHKAFSEETALLASFALTSAGFELLTKIELPKGNEVAVLKKAVREASRSVGILGLIGGQHLDLSPPNLSTSIIEEIIDKKTCSLFELSFVLGWIFSEGSLDKVDSVKVLGNHFGRAFQILDDIDDFEQDLKAEKNINFAVRFGKEAAIKQVQKHIESFEEYAVSLNLFSDKMATLVNAMRDVCLTV